MPLELPEIELGISKQTRWIFMKVKKRAGAMVEATRLALNEPRHRAQLPKE